MDIHYNYEFDPYECAYCGNPRVPRKDEWPEKGEEILEHHYGRRNWLSQLVHEVRDEW